MRSHDRLPIEVTVREFIACAPCSCGETFTATHILESEAIMHANISRDSHLAEKGMKYLHATAPAR